MPMRRLLTTTTSVLAITVALSEAARAQCAAAITSSQAGCTNSGSQGSIVVNTGVTVTGALANTGTLTGAGSNFGIYVATGATVTSGITNAGTIASPSSSGYQGAIVVMGTVSSGGVTNAGKITSSYYGIAAGTGKYTTGKLGKVVGNIVNAGAITSTGIGIAVYGSLTGSILNSGTLNNTNAGGVMVSYNSSVAGSIVNSGSITSASGIGIGVGRYSNNGGSTVGGGITNTNSGVITAATNGISIYNHATVGGGVTNAGVITAKQIGIYVANSTITGGITNSGTITGATGVAIVGVAGTLTNSGTIVGTGGTAVQFGNFNNTLILGSGATFGGQVQGGTGTNTLVLQGYNLASLSQFVGFGSTILVQGGGSIISGNFTIPSLTVTGGLTIDGSVTANSQNLGAGASIAIGDATHAGAALTATMTLAGGTLSGFGTLTGALTNTSGTVSPGGGSVGTLTVAGTYAQAANGTLAIQVARPGAAKLAVAGTASLAGALAVTATPDLYVVNGARLPILTASTTTGTFTQTSGLVASPRLSFSLAYQSSEVDLVASQVTFASLAGTGNQRAVGALLDRLASQPPAALVPAIDALLNLTPQQSPAALDAVGGAAQHYGGLASAGIVGAQATAGTVGEQLFQSHGGAGGGSASNDGPGAQRVQFAALDPLATLAEGPAPPRAAGASPWSAWLDGYGIFGGIGGNANSHGLNYTTGGTAFGADYRLDPALLVGAFTGFAGTGTSAPGLSGAGTVDAYSFGAYASWTAGPLYVDGMVGYAYDSDRLTRTIAFPGFAAVTARASTDANQFMSAVETGRSVALQDGFLATPFVGLQATTLDQASFTESGAGALDLAVGGQSTSSVRTQLGSRLTRDVALVDGHVVTIGIKVAWAHELSDTGTTTTASFAGAPGASFAVQGAQRGRDSALVGLGVASKLDASSSVFLRYDGDIDGADNAHAVIGGIRLTW